MAMQGGSQETKSPGKPADPTNASAHVAAHMLLPPMPQACEHHPHPVRSKHVSTTGPGPPHSDTSPRAPPPPGSWRLSIMTPRSPAPPPGPAARTHMHPPTNTRTYPSLHPSPPAP